jgi:uncharacterized repeat protein (TIGR01451 family)
MNLKVSLSKSRILKMILFSYTVLVFVILLISSNTVLNTKSAFAFCTDDCKASCHSGCDQGDPQYRDACHSGCGGACDGRCQDDNDYTNECPNGDCGLCGDGNSSCTPDNPNWGEQGDGYEGTEDPQVIPNPVNNNDGNNPIGNGNNAPSTNPTVNGNTLTAGTNPAGQADGSVAVGASCTAASNCFGLRCPYPLNSYCGPSGCECRAVAEQTVNACNDQWQAVKVVNCPSGWSQCSPGEAGCQFAGDTVMTCQSCNNTSVWPMYCKPPTPGQPVVPEQTYNPPAQPGVKNCFTCTGVVNSQRSCGASTQVNENDSCPSGTFESQAACLTGPATPVCPVLNPGIIIEKTVVGSRSYFVGDPVSFRVRITNTGQTTFTNVRFYDQYIPTFLRYIGGSAVKSTGESIADINPVLTTRNDGYIEIANVATTALGLLGPGQYYEFTLTLIVNAPTFNSNTCNVAYVTTPGLPDRMDDDCIVSRNRDTDL